MAITYPRSMPADFVGEGLVFEAPPVDFGSPETSGRLGAVQAGFPVWQAVFPIAASIGAAKSDEVRAWLASLDGAKRQFYGADPSRPLPLLYPAGFTGLTRAGGGSFDGTATSWSVDTAGEVVTLNGLPASFRLSIGDYVGFIWTTDGEPRRGLARCQEAVTANGSGVAAVTVRPALSSAISDDATATLDHPTCLMRIDVGQTKLGGMGRRLAISGTIYANQDLRP